MYTKACWTCVSFFICLFVCLSILGYWNGLTRLRYCIMLPRSCKACMCGNSVSKHIFHLFICLFVCLSTLGYWNGLNRLRCCIKLSRSCKACTYGNSVSKDNLGLTFYGESVSKIYLCEDCWQPSNNYLYYVKVLLCGNEAGCELLLSFFLGGFGLRYWFFWEVPRIFERWPCSGHGLFIGWGMRIAAVIKWIYFEWTQCVILWIVQYVVLLT